MEKKNKYVRMNTASVDPKMFERFPTGKPIDKIISDDGGVMRGTVIMAIGDPGVGKTTITNDVLSDIQVLYPDANILFVSSEEGLIDRAYNHRKSPKTGETLILFLGDVDNKVQVLEETFREGWDIILVDSFKDVQDKIQAENPGMTINEAEAWLLNQMVDCSHGSNDKKIYTTFICIQQVTKGKEFVGSNALKHNTTAMMEVRFSKEYPGQRYVVFTKNRRCGEHVGKKLYYTFDKTSKELVYSEEPFLDQLEIPKANSTVLLPKKLYSVEELLKYIPHGLASQDARKALDKVKEKIAKGEPVTVHR